MSELNGIDVPVRFGPHKSPLAAWGDYRKVQIHRREMLYRSLNTRTVVAFTGAGCSFPLGYPSWTGFGEYMILAAMDIAAPHQLPTLQTLKERIAEHPGSGDLVYALSTVQKIFRLNSLQDTYKRLLSGLFGRPDPQRPRGRNPYHQLLRLPISRFVTSNYDCELERALVEKRSLQESLFVLPEDDRSAQAEVAEQCKDKPGSFTQRDHKHLARFALSGVGDVDTSVFHCHGHYLDPDSMVVSEQDYREEYLGPPESRSPGFQQTLSLLFGSNPILFLGYGLGDDDLLRPLRMFIASAKSTTSARPLFALMPIWQDDDINEPAEISPSNCSLEKARVGRTFLKTGP